MVKGKQVLPLFLWERRGVLHHLLRSAAAIAYLEVELQYFSRRKRHAALPQARG